MEETTEGQSDSDVSDSWSLVDYKIDDIADLMQKEKSTETKKGRQQDLDECFELTEMTADDGPQTPRFQSSPKKIKELHDSDGDTDGISVISDEEDYASWRQAAHDNYNNTMKLLDTSENLFRRCLPKDETAPSLNDNVSKTNTKPDDVNSVTLAKDNVEVDTDADDSWQETCSNFLDKYFITSAVIAAITCIALAQFIKSYGSKDKMTEMLEALDRLRNENALLKSQLDDVTTAHAALEAKMTEIRAAPLPTLRDAPYLDRTTLLADLAKISTEGDIKVRKVAEDLFRNLGQLPQSQDFQTLEDKIANNVLKVLKGGENIDKAVQRLKDLNSRLRHKSSVWKRRSGNNSDGIKIVQWFPEEKMAGVLKSETIVVEESHGSTVIDDTVNIEMTYKNQETSFDNDQNSPLPKGNENVNNEQSYVDANVNENALDSQTDAENERESMVTDPLLANSNTDVPAIHTLKNEEFSEPPRAENRPVAAEATKQSAGQKRKHWSGDKKFKKSSQQKLPKYQKYDRKSKKNVNKVKNVPSENNDWYNHRTQGRENMRDSQPPKRVKDNKIKYNKDKCGQDGNKTSDWFTARGKARQVKRDIEDKAMWYFRKIETRGAM